MRKSRITRQNPRLPLARHGVPWIIFDLGRPRALSRLLFGAVFLLPALAFSAAEAEPVPSRVLRYQGRDVPLYDITDVTPRTTVRPTYPSAMRRDGVGGVAIVLALVSTEGSVADLAIKSSVPAPAFGEAARECVRKWTFPRMKRGGAPTEFLVLVTIEFSIED